MKKILSLLALSFLATQTWAGDYRTDNNPVQGLGGKVYQVKAYWHGNSTTYPMVHNGTGYKVGATTDATPAYFYIVDMGDNFSYTMFDVSGYAFNYTKTAAEANVAQRVAFFNTGRNNSYAWISYETSEDLTTDKTLARQTFAVNTANGALNQYSGSGTANYIYDQGSVNYGTYTTDFILEEVPGYTLYKVVAPDGGTVTTSLTTKAQVNGGYVVVNGEATTSSFTCSEGCSVKSVDNVNKTVTTQGDSYTVETGTKAYTDIVSERGGKAPTLIKVKSGATLDIDGAYECSNIAAEDGSTLIVSTTNTDIAAITGNVNVVINENYDFVGSKSTKATGKLTVNAGKQLTIGGGQAQTNSLESFTSLQVYGTLYNNNKNTVLKNVTFEDGSVLHSYDMNEPGNNAANGTYSNALRLTGTTVINGVVNSTSYYNAQYSIDKLAGDGTLKIRGKSASEFATMNNEAAYYTISNTSEFTGKLDIKNTDARITPIENVTILNNLFVKTATLTNITITGNTRIEAAGNITINGPVTNNLANNTYGYAFVGNNDGSIINLSGNIDLTQVNETNNSNDKIGYNRGMFVNITSGANIIAGGVYNSSATLANNANVTIENNATLTVKDKLLTPNLTNNGTIKLLNLSATRYTATAVNAETFNVIVSKDVLSGMSNASYTIVTDVTTNNVTAYTLNGESSVTLNGYVYAVKQAEGGNNIVLTREQLSYSATITAGDNGNFGTLCLPYATTVPANVNAYTLTTLENDRIAFTKAYTAGSTLPANEPVLLSADNAGSYAFVGTADAAKVGTNLFLGTPNAEQVDMSNSDIYVLAKDGNNICFMRTTAGNVNPYKAYIKTSVNLSAKAIKIDFDEVITAIEDVVTSNSENIIFDLSGRRVNNARNGFYIVNGKKVIR